VNNNQRTAISLDPVTPDNAVVLFVDQQESILGRSYEQDQTRRHVIGLGRCARLLGVPVILSTNMASGSNGAQIVGLTELFPDQAIDRTVIDAWREERVREAIARTGRRKVLIAGTGLDVCATLPALSALADGLEPYVVVDACGRFEPLPATALTRLAQAGVAVATTQPLVLEMMADNAHPKARDVYGALMG
jgi:nicotinamidase-related amidase